MISIVCRIRKFDLSSSLKFGESKRIRFYIATEKKERKEKIMKNKVDFNETRSIHRNH